MSPWQLSYRADPRALPLANRHYNRQSLESDQFVPPGKCLVLLTPDADALWVTSWPKAQYVKHAWAGAWVCSLFRNESGGRSSDMIRLAVAHTRWKWSYLPVPALGMVTFIDPEEVKPIKVRGRPTWGYSWKKAGFIEDGQTQGGLLAFRLKPEDMPEAVIPQGLRGQRLLL